VQEFNTQLERIRLRTVQHVGAYSAGIIDRPASSQMNACWNTPGIFIFSFEYLTVTGVITGDVQPLVTI